MKTVISRCFFAFESHAVIVTVRLECHKINYLVLINLANCSTCAGEYWPSIVFVQTSQSLHSVQ